MAKRFKLKFSCVLRSFQLCRLKKASNLPGTPVPAIHWLSPVNPKTFDIGYPNMNLPAPPPSTPDYSFIKRHLSPKIASVSCGCGARSSTQYLGQGVRNSKLQRKGYEASFSDESNGDIAAVLESRSKVKNKGKKIEKVKGIPSSRDGGCFNSEGAENEETQTLISTSRSFSDDSSFELDHSQAEDSHMETKKSKKKLKNTKKKMNRLRSFGSKKYRGASKPNVSKTETGAPSSSEAETPGRGSMLRRMMIPPRTAEGKVKESVAVVKKSEDPYEDFKRSMTEMILEKQMFEAKDLEQLLQCFLSLNSRQHHGIIVEAFTDIWEALFCDYPMNVV